MDEAGKPMRGWRGFRRGGGGLSRERGGGQLALGGREREKAVTRIRACTATVVAEQQLQQCKASALVAAVLVVQGKRQMGRSGWSRQQHSVQSHNSQSSSSSGVFSSRSNGGSGGDVRGRWRREINVSNHLEVELKGSSIPNSRILQTTAANLKFHPVLNLKSTSETGDFPSEGKFRFP